MSEGRKSLLAVSTYGYPSSFWLICPRCGERCVSRHCCGCWTCKPSVPPGTPNSVAVAWECDIPGRQTLCWMSIRATSWRVSR